MEAQLPLGMWDFGSLIGDQLLNPSPPALPGGFLTTRPPGRSLKILLLKTGITSLIWALPKCTVEHTCQITVISSGFRRTQPQHKGFLHTFAESNTLAYKFQSDGCKAAINRFPASRFPATL